MGDISKQTKGYVCEDHFNLEEDMENYIKWKLMGGKIFLKESVVPHIFVCQEDRKRSLPPAGRKGSSKRVCKEMINKLLQEYTDTDSTDTDSQSEVLPVEEIQPTDTKEDESVNNKYTQTDTIKTITIGVQCKGPNFRSKSVQVNSISVIPKINIACSPIKIPKSPLKVIIHPKEKINASSSSDFNISDSISIPNILSSEQSTNFSEEHKMDRIKAISIERNNYLCEKKCRIYLGIPNDCRFIITLLVEATKCDIRNIYITLKKIRTNLSFEYLADDFGISASQAAKIFKNTLPLIHCCIKKYIFWPEKDKIKKVLPLAFRANYHKVQSIIDCFEIEIDKPNDPIKQTGTWSEYKKSNTIKYLISATPDGFINFISKGFGGRTSDINIVKKSGYLEILPKNCSVMADRGFKRIDTLLQPLNCTLIRPPSVRVGIKSTKDEVLETKRIASLRIHIERVIRRVREFKILKPHACVHIKLIMYLDQVVAVACGLVNMQSEIIKVDN